MALRDGAALPAHHLPLQSLPLEGIRAREQAIHRDDTHLHRDITHTNAESKMTIKEAQELVDRWIREYGVRYFSELTNMTVLTE